MPYNLNVLVHDPVSGQQQGLRFQFDPAVSLTNSQLTKLKIAITAAAQSIQQQVDVIAANPTPANVAEAL